MITIDITMPIHIINMLFLIVVLNAVLYRPIRGILIERKKKIAGLRTDIENFEKNAQLRLEEFEQKLAEARTQAKGEFDAVRAEAQKAGAEKVAAIRAEADAEKGQQLSAIQEQFTKARQELQGQLDSFAGDMAEKILRRAV